MPRRRSRFSDLEKQFRQSGGVAAPGSAVAKYIEFKSGKTKIERRTTVKLTELERTRYGVSLLPFNVPAPATPADIGSRYGAAITGFSLGGVTALALDTDKLGMGKISDETKTAMSSGGYYPALIRPIVYTGTTKTPASSITGKEYKYKEARSYGIPFGRVTATAATDTEETRRKVLAGLCTDATGTAKAGSVGYDPEVFRSESAPLNNAPGV